jgi:hypothetical protein
MESRIVGILPDECFNLSQNWWDVTVIDYARGGGGIVPANGRS